jgi:hypothetical protein
VERFGARNFPSFGVLYMLLCRTWQKYLAREAVLFRDLTTDKMKIVRREYVTTIVQILLHS